MGLIKPYYWGKTFNGIGTLINLMAERYAKEKKNTQYLGISLRAGRWAN